MTCWPTNHFPLADSARTAVLAMTLNDVKLCFAAHAEFFREVFPTSTSPVRGRKGISILIRHGNPGRERQVHLQLSQHRFLSLQPPTQFLWTRVYASPKLVCRATVLDIIELYSYSVCAECCFAGQDSAIAREYPADQGPKCAHLKLRSLALLVFRRVDI